MEGAREPEKGGLRWARVDVVWDGVGREWVMLDSVGLDGVGWEWWGGGGVGWDMAERDWAGYDRMTG